MPYSITDNGSYSYGEYIGDVYVAFNSNQVKDIRNENPTDDPDIRYSLRDLEGHDEIWYNHHGWAKVNGVLDDFELASFMREATNNIGKYPQNDQGLYVIPISSRNEQGAFTVLTDGAEYPSVESVWQMLDTRRDILAELTEVFDDV